MSTNLVMTCLQAVEQTCDYEKWVVKIKNTETGNEASHNFMMGGVVKAVTPEDKWPDVVKYEKARAVRNCKRDLAVLDGVDARSYDLLVLA